MKTRKNFWQECRSTDMVCLVLSHSRLITVYQQTWYHPAFRLKNYLTGHYVFADYDFFLFAHHFDLIFAFKAACVVPVSSVTSSAGFVHHSSFTRRCRAS